MSGLNRGLGLWAGIAVNVANVIGTGVFLKTRVMTCNVDDPMIVMAVWLAAGLLSLLGAFCYAELASMMPAAGGDYVFLRRAYGKPTSFLYGWTVFAIMKTGSQAALAVGFAIFMNAALGGVLDQAWLTLPLGDGISFTGLTVVALSALWLVTLFNCASVSTTGSAATVLTVMKVLTVLAVGIGSVRVICRIFPVQRAVVVVKACKRVQWAVSLVSVLPCSVPCGLTTAGITSRRFVVR
jgi:APA family basic amino acid/polyamine antiporter